MLLLAFRFQVLKTDTKHYKEIKDVAARIKADPEWRGKITDNINDFRLDAYNAGVAKDEAKGKAAGISSAINALRKNGVSEDIIKLVSVNA